MPGAGFAVTRGARAITHRLRVGGEPRHADKAWANRRNRRHIRQELHAHGEDADLAPLLWTEWTIL